MSDHHDEHEFSLVMPFTVCQSKGGPYEDDAFTAGYECGLIDALLDAGTEEVQRTVHAPLVPQLDLLAMRHGYTFDHVPCNEYPDEWTLATFQRQGNDGRADP